ncbi:H-X9-DG-CTERM domain-containing protein, partial [Bremerella sp. JC817]|uniref:H-X9-DG-CTERM domain-containing protein n=1 Tax=Bremerella sp. JC817 TaxID=3231756 RepID=UPI003457FADA
MCLPQRYRFGLAWCRPRRSGPSCSPRPATWCHRQPCGKVCWRGALFTSGWTAVNGFTTMTPPNSPRCQYGRNANIDWAVLPPASNHPGGVMLGMLDGSVTFI